MGTLTTMNIREQMRLYSLERRCKSREHAVDAMRFGLGEIQQEIKLLGNFTMEDVKRLAVRIKQNKHATTDDMFQLSSAFLQDLNNIHEFDRVPGAIQVIVKELTGNNAERRIGAVDCLCNFSLGDGHVCERLVSVAGSYLVTFLSSAEDQVKRSSLWAIANILATSLKAASELVCMELVPRLWNIYTFDGTAANASGSNIDVRQEAAVCLQLLANISGSIFREKDFVFLKNHFTAKQPHEPGGSQHLQILFLCDIIRPDATLDDKQMVYLINYSLWNLIHTPDISSNDNKIRIIFAIRILTNLLASARKSYEMLLHELQHAWDTTLVYVFNRLFGIADERITSDSLWLLRNCIEIHKVCAPNIPNADELLRVLISYCDNNSLTLAPLS